MTNRIQGTTKLMGLIGYPLKHSKSPHMHNTAFEALGLDYVYLAFEIKDGYLKEALDALKILNVEGFNVTMPHKTKIIEYLDEIAPDAKIIGAVNTVKYEEGRLIGYNTDGRGFVKSLEEKGVEFKGEKIVLVGGGGAARAVASQLAFEGAGEIVLFNRTLSKAEEIVGNINKNVPDCESRALELNESLLIEEIQDAKLLVDCTSLGMKDTIDQSIISSPDYLPKDLFVADIVYGPYKTKLLKIAEEAGCRYMNGLMMMIWQGAIAFKIWTGKDMPIKLIKEEILDK
ncbi:MAG: shikimate dehydrogenase [Tissierellia bacterium]|nr:shikimate dehydrogenase [Tissierellia bacterium]